MDDDRTLDRQRSHHSEVRLAAALARIDAANAHDPNLESDGTPHALAYGRRMSAWLERLAPDASDGLRIAVRAQHLERWRVPRDDFPRDRAGYFRWRTTLARMHAERAGAIAAAVGYDAAVVARIQALIRKEGLRGDPETQTLEDAACLVFLETELADFAARHDEAKIVDILRKTWRKMSANAREAALGLDLPAPLKALVAKAVA